MKSTHLLEEFDTFKIKKKCFIDLVPELIFILFLSFYEQWQETEDFGRKKEIRTHMYKLREARLRDFYVSEMDTKTPITSRHGNAMADHSFESLKSNEIHGTDSPMR